MFQMVEGFSGDGNFSHSTRKRPASPPFAWRRRYRIVPITVMPFIGLCNVRQRHSTLIAPAADARQREKPQTAEAAVCATGSALALRCCCLLLRLPSIQERCEIPMLELFARVRIPHMDDRIGLRAT